MFEMLWRKKTLILFLVALVILLPPAVARPAQMLSKAVLTEVAIDRTADGYVFGGIMADGDKETAVMATAPTIGDAINKIALEQSKQVSFAHCTDIVLGEGLKDDNLADILKFFLYRNELNNNCAVAWKEKGGRTTLEQFYKDYMYYSSAVALAQGSTDTAVILDGRYKLSLDERETDALNLIKGKKMKKNLVYKDKVVSVSENSGKIKTKFINGVPTVDISVKIKGGLASDPDAVKKDKDSVANALKSELETNINAIIAKLYGTTDVLGFYNTFYRWHTKKFKAFMEQNSFADFMSALDFNVKVDISL